jgi:hypothetical protein
MAILTVGAVLVAACDGGGSGHPSRSSEPVPSTGSSTAPSLSPSPSRTGPLTTGPGVQPGEKPPVLDAEAKQHTASGALAFAIYYFKAFDWGYATTDPSLVEQISAPSCRACRSYVDGLASVRARGGHVEGGRITIRSANLATGSFTVKSERAVEVNLSEDAVVLVSPSAAPSTAATSISRDTSLVFVSWAAGRWQVVEVGAP